MGHNGRYGVYRALQPGPIRPASETNQQGRVYRIPAVFASLAKPQNQGFCGSPSVPFFATNSSLGCPSAKLWPGRCVQPVGRHARGRRTARHPQKRPHLGEAAACRTCNLVSTLQQHLHHQLWRQRQAVRPGGDRPERLPDEAQRRGRIVGGERPEVPRACPRPTQHIAGRLPAPLGQEAPRRVARQEAAQDLRPLDAKQRSVIGGHRRQIGRQDTTDRCRRRLSCWQVFMRFSEQPHRRKRAAPACQLADPREAEALVQRLAGRRGDQPRNRCQSSSA